MEISTCPKQRIHDWQTSFEIREKLSMLNYGVNYIDKKVISWICLRFKDTFVKHFMFSIFRRFLASEPYYHMLRRDVFPISWYLADACGQQGLFEKSKLNIYMSSIIRVFRKLTTLLHHVAIDIRMFIVTDIWKIDELEFRAMYLE